MERCNQGHFYDKDKYTRCPYCGVVDLEMRPTCAVNAISGEDQLLETVQKQEIEKGEPVITPYSCNDEPGETVGIVRRKIGIDPVVGWLVCIEGVDKGRDYRIRSEKNVIGRSERMDICIAGDKSISRDNHACVVFNPNNRSFRVQVGDSRGLVYLNGSEVISHSELKPYDVIEIGATKLAFIPFCGENFNWV